MNPMINEEISKTYTQCTPNFKLNLRGLDLRKRISLKPIEKIKEDKNIQETQQQLTNVETSQKYKITPL